ncbi:uncharacterized protein JN550_004275 [Neoarthrinium moseri]|uniref:uncharacterized protein n=1 Tax=Neoarthrinium moseri TaxID=1658444 RepID=UPI001FDB2DC3|nr:uncharacterized protein JN550_004275 [Neoarthrinium moseri]KAI1872072.1 hypothetical protein JN550_004275 [Neoarthrinium moseri]
MFRPLLLRLLPLTLAREFSHIPKLAAGQKPFHLDSSDDVDIVTGSRFYGLKTFANLPYVHCFSGDGASAPEAFDIAFMGAPFDTIDNPYVLKGVTARPGARYGPGGIRTGSQRMGAEFAWSVYTGRNPLKSWATVVDCGDAPLVWLDNTVAIKQLDKAHRVVSGRKAANTSYSVTPRIITLGGDHTTTLSALRSTHESWGPVSVVHFDSHLGKCSIPLTRYDLFSDDMQIPGIRKFLNLILNSSIHAGIRAPLSRAKGDMRNDLRCGFHTIKARDLDRIGAAGVISQIKERVGDSKVYISVDIDVLDPAFAPATGTAEPGGWSTRELLTILDGLIGLEVVGADVVEVAPIYDNPGETTVLAAAEVAFSLLELMVETPVKSLAD